MMNNNSCLLDRKTVKNFQSVITIGLEEGYSQRQIAQKDVYTFVSSYQNQLIEKENIYLSASISECDIVLSGQCEKHLQIRFINYPKFPMEKEVLKNHVEILARLLMNEFSQNRIVIEHLDETVMFEMSDSIDPRIK